MSDTQHTQVTVLGLGAMGQALAVTLAQGGRPTTVWNRTPGKDTALVAAGATSAATVADAIGQHGPIIAVLLDHTYVHATLDPYARVIDSGDYTAPFQPLDFHKPAVDAIVRASCDAGVALDIVTPIKNLIDRQIADGHGPLAFERTVEELA